MCEFLENETVEVRTSTRNKMIMEYKREYADEAKRLRGRWQLTKLDKKLEVRRILSTKRTA